MKPTKQDFTVNHNGVTVFASVSPCSWMYPNYGMQVQVATKKNACNAESELIKWSTPFDQSSDADVTTHIIAFMNAGGVAKLEQKVVSWAVESKKLRAEIDRAEVRAKARAAKYAAKMKAEGYTHRVLAWVHPASGDDYQVEFFSKRQPTDAEIVKLLKNRRSQVTNDFCVEAL